MSKGSGLSPHKVSQQLSDKFKIEYPKSDAYFPIILEDEAQTLKLQKALNEQDIFPRRYFYPSLDTLSYIEPKQYAPISRDISNRILALPMYPQLSEKEQSLILDIIKETI